MTETPRQAQPSHAGRGDIVEALSKTEAGEAAADAEVERLRMALDTLIGRLETWPLNFSTGVCMCGAEMEGHSVYDGHAPTDSGEYNVLEAIKEAKSFVFNPDKAKENQ